MLRSTILITALVASTPCLAEAPDTEVKREVVSYGDLDISTASGRATLDRRISVAAYRVCYEPGFSLQDTFRHGRCRAATIADARRQVRSVTVEMAMNVTATKP